LGGKEGGVVETSENTGAPGEQGSYEEGVLTGGGGEGIPGVSFLGFQVLRGWHKGTYGR